MDINKMMRMEFHGEYNTAPDLIDGKSVTVACLQSYHVLKGHNCGQDNNLVLCTIFAR